jgi:hypothetical protein
MRAVLYFVFAALVGFIASCGGGSVAQIDMDDQIRTASDDPGPNAGGPAVDPLYVFYNSEDDDLE